MTVKIISAALKVGRLIVSLPAPARHHHVIKELCSVTGRSSEGHGNQGFLTNEGKFVGRREAIDIARQNGQLLGEPTDGSGFQLYSEDLW